MTDEGATGTDAAGKGLAGQIYDCAIGETLKRLRTIDQEDRDDNVAFDRAARTALVFLRIAEGAASLAARKRKEQTDNEQNGANAGESARIARDEQELKRRLDAYIAGLAGRKTEGDCSDDVAQDRASAGDRT